MEKGVIMAYVKYILKKLIQIVVITFLVSLLVFFSLRLNPTSPLTVIIGNKQSTPELQQQYTEQFDLDEPLLKQYIIWLKGIAHGEYCHKRLHDTTLLGEKILTSLNQNYGKFFLRSGKKYCN